MFVSDVDECQKNIELCHCFFQTLTVSLFLSDTGVCHVSFRHCVIVSFRQWLCHCFFKSLSMSLCFFKVLSHFTSFRHRLFHGVFQLVSDTDCVIWLSDIDECRENLAFCSQQDSTCINTRGSYKCPVVRCPEGFAKTTAAGPQNRWEFCCVKQICCWYSDKIHGCCFAVMPVAHCVVFLFCF